MAESKAKRRSFDSRVKYMCTYKKTFQTTKFGVQKEIIYRDKPTRYLDEMSERSISQVCKAVKDCCKDYMNEYGMPEKIDIDVRTYYKDKIMFDRMYNDCREKKGVFIDVQSCYWNIMYEQLGYITRKVYLKYFDMKTERNTAIGNLRKRKIIDYFVDGEHKPKLQEVIENPFLVFNHNVRATAYQYYLDLTEKLGIDTIFLFQTDGYFIFDDSPKRAITYKALKYFRDRKIDIDIKSADYSDYKDGKINVVLTDFYKKTNPVKETKIISL